MAKRGPYNKSHNARNPSEFNPTDLTSKFIEVREHAIRAFANRHLGSNGITNRVEVNNYINNLLHQIEVTPGKTYTRVQVEIIKVLDKLLSEPM